MLPTLTHALASRGWQLAIIGIAAMWLSFVSLGDAPIYLGGDEAHFGNQALALSRTGCDLSGHLMPIFVSLRDPLGDREDAANTSWYQPILFYLVAIVLKVRPLTEASVRTPTAAIAVIDAFLIYFVARRIFEHPAIPLIASFTVALASMHFMLAREALDYVVTLPFALVWLLLLTRRPFRVGTGRALAIGLVLGFGVFSYIAAWLLMPLLLLLTLAVVWRYSGRAAAATGAMAVGFAVPLAAGALWCVNHPAMMHDTFSRYAQVSARAPEAEPGVARLFERLEHAGIAYASLLDPWVLFVRGGPNVTTGTRRSGVFLASTGVFLLAGIYRLLKVEASPTRTLLLWTLLLAPLPAAVLGEPRAVQRAVVLVPAVALVAMAGVEWMLHARQAVMRTALWMLLAMMPLQFGLFAYDYFGHYTRRSAFYYDSGNIRGVVETLVASRMLQSAPLIHLSNQLDDASSRWRFFLTKHWLEEG